MTTTDLPILYSFRRCPYAMRARMAIYAAGTSVELREVVLRDKPPEMLEISPKGTVPVLILPDGSVIDESFDVMLWALGKNDPENWLEPETGTRLEMLQLIELIEGPFKQNLDRYKYPPRYTHENEGEGVDAELHRDKAFMLLMPFQRKLKITPYLFGAQPTLADMATAPFIRQFANTDRDWFDAQPIPKVQAWLEGILSSEAFTGIMKKYPQWQSPETGIKFPD